jgi:hypothetical protein
MSRDKSGIQDIQLDDLGRIVLSDPELSHIDILEGTSAGGANSYCNGTINGTCQNSVSCGLSGNSSCNNLLACVSSQNISTCAVPSEIDP